MKRLVLTLFLLAVPATAAAQMGNRGQVRERALLERQIMQRYAGQIGTEIGLAPTGQARMERWLVQSNQSRRDFARETMEIRRRLADAVHSPTTTDEEFEKVLSDLQEVRRRELEQLQADEEALRDSLSPRQRAQVVLGLARLQDRIRDLISQRRLPEPR